MISAELGKPLESYVQELVSSGRYGSKSEVLREGVRMIQERETQQEALKALIMQGMADIEAGRTHSAEDVFGAMRQRIQATIQEKQ
ncbi:antitoxin ParD1/3/4 [Acinetobacter marinus]|uniref:Antitoxin ParD n=1 Tax=Acinetobacter marinus TaxID=281375 RepID=A0A1G6GZS4_9GAMM|nr:type II toxin-antitoxin system ParD family antitoxin [Acinetobacter marinus]SDB87451.1 antitoxin ParD1/3/4 [Acinetobacter marinus]